MRRSVRRTVLGSAIVMALVAFTGGAFAASTTWKRVASPNPPDSTSRLIAVSGVPGTLNPWAVGTSEPADGDGTQATALIERWNGTAWVLVDPGVTPPGAILQDVGATSSTDAWAVGTSLDINYQLQPLALHWDGTAWSSVPIPGDPQNPSSVRSEAEWSPDNVWGAGYSGGGPSTTAMLWHWDGTAWSIVAPTLPAGTTASAFGSIKKIPGLPGQLMVSGTATVNGVSQIVVERYDGSSWTILPAPSTANNPRAGGMAVKSASNVWLVGSVTKTLPNGGGTSVPYSTHWNGKTWTQRAMPWASGTASGNAVTVSIVPGSSQAWAVGVRSGGPGDIPLSWQWNGSKWVSATVPNPANGNVLSGVAAISGGPVWAVGWNEGPSSVGGFVVRR